MLTLYHPKPWIAGTIVWAVLCGAFLFAPVPSSAQWVPDTARRSASPLDRRPDPKRLSTNLKSFGVPFKINDNGQFIEVQLYLSRDKGRTWTFYRRQTTDQSEFPFEAKQDGEYWFALKTLNRDRKLLPAGDPQVELKIIVDTVKPELDFRIQSDSAGRVLCRWQARDTNLMPGSLKIFYQPITDQGSLKSWMQVPVQLRGKARNGVYSDQIGWWPETTESAVNVAVQIQDTAGNTTRIDRKVALPNTAWKGRNVATARPQPTASLRPSYNNRRPSPPVQQPDWAEPEWTPQTKPDDQPRTARQQAAGSQFAQRPAVPINQASTRVNPNVICEDGVCKIVGDGNGMFDTPGKHVLPNPPANQTQSPADQSAQTAPTRTASRGPASPTWVGSPEEYVDPPIPTGYRPTDSPPPVAQQTDDLASPASVPWKSQQQRWLPDEQVAAATTRRVDPSITPTPANPVSQAPTTFVPSNPARTRVEGDQVISESTTMSPRNQYRGGNLTAADNPAPELLPGNPGDFHRKPTLDNLPSAGKVAFQETPFGRMQRLGGNQENESSGPTYSGAGFSKPIHSANDQPTSVLYPSTVKPVRETKASTQIIGSQRFRLNYGIDSIDPSGVGRVDLWISKDDGQTWKLWGNDPDNRSPFPVEVEEQGRFGFRIVVHSQDGLSGVGPSSGDDADMWILVDTQPPLASIQSVPYGRGEEVGKLVINYGASDNYLSLRPITLSYAQQPNGPWQIIEAGLRNEGRYVWKVNQQVPDLIYLRIEAVDRAGNVGVHTLSRPIDVSGLVPSGRIHGVTPVSNRQPAN